MNEQNSNEIRVYVGTYTHGDSEGIYVYRLNLSSGALELESKATGVESPSFLALHPEHRFLYSVNAVQKVDGVPSGGVSAFPHRFGYRGVVVLKPATLLWAGALPFKCRSYRSIRSRRKLCGR